jgi:hypothetical protein
MGVVISHSFPFSASRRLKFSYKSILPCTAQVFRRDSPGKAAQWLGRSIRESWGGVVVSHSFPSRASRRLKFSHNSILPRPAFPSTLVSMLELSPPLPILLLPRVGGLSALSTRAIETVLKIMPWVCVTRDRLCGLVVRFPDYRSRGSDSIPCPPYFLRSSASETESTQHRVYNWGATWEDLDPM